MPVVELLHAYSYSRNHFAFLPMLHGSLKGREEFDNHDVCMITCPPLILPCNAILVTCALHHWRLGGHSATYSPAASACSHRWLYVCSCRWDPTIPDKLEGELSKTLKLGFVAVSPWAVGPVYAHWLLHCRIQMAVLNSARQALDSVPLACSINSFQVRGRTPEELARQISRDEMIHREQEFIQSRPELNKARHRLSGAVLLFIVLYQSVSGSLDVIVIGCVLLVVAACFFSMACLTPLASPSEVHLRHMHARA